MPKFNFQSDLEKIAQRIIIPSLAQGIKNRVSIDGTNFPELEPETIARKGHDQPLIGLERKLFRSFVYKKKGKFAVMVTLNQERKAIGGYLQIDGVRSKRGLKHFRFFGITKKMEGLAINYMRQQINKGLNRGKR